MSEPGRIGGVGPAADGDVAHIAKDRAPDREGLRIPGVVDGVALDLGEGAVLDRGGAVDGERGAVVAREVDLLERRAGGPDPDRLAVVVDQEVGAGGGDDIDLHGGGIGPGWGIEVEHARLPVPLAGGVELVEVVVDEVARARIGEVDRRRSPAGSSSRVSTGPCWAIGRVSHHQLHLPPAHLGAGPPAGRHPRAGGELGVDDLGRYSLSLSLRRKPVSTLGQRASRTKRPLT